MTKFKVRRVVRLPKRSGRLLSMLSNEPEITSTVDAPSQVNGRLEPTGQPLTDRPPKPTIHWYGEEREDGYRFVQYYWRASGVHWLELWRKPEWFSMLPKYRANQMQKLKGDPVRLDKKRLTEQQWRGEKYSTEKRLISAAHQRARTKGLPFNLSVGDVVVPLVCPVLGIPLVRGHKVSHDGSPQLDRMIPSLGYVRGNVAVISKLANTIKSNATPQQIRAVADWFDAKLRSSSFMS